MIDELEIRLVDDGEHSWRQAVEKLQQRVTQNDSAGRVVGVGYIDRFGLRGDRRRERVEVIAATSQSDRYADGPHFGRIDRIDRKGRPTVRHLIARFIQRLREIVEHGIGAVADDDLVGAHPMAGRQGVAQLVARSVRIAIGVGNGARDRLECGRDRSERSLVRRQLDDLPGQS